LQLGPDDARIIAMMPALIFSCSTGHAATMIFRPESWPTVSAAAASPELAVAAGPCLNPRFGKPVQSLSNRFGVSRFFAGSRKVPMSIRDRTRQSEARS
jgi:hypothetical protein